MEVSPMLFTGEKSRANWKLWFFIYGFRVCGEKIFGDFGFGLPFSVDFIKEGWKYIPLGIPYFTIGIRF